MFSGLLGDNAPFFDVCSVFSEAHRLMFLIVSRLPRAQTLVFLLVFGASSLGTWQDMEAFYNRSPPDEHLTTPVTIPVSAASLTLDIRKTLRDTAAPCVIWKFLRGTY